MTKLLGETVELRCTVLGYRQRALNSCQTHENQLIYGSELSCSCLVFWIPKTTCSDILPRPGRHSVSWTRTTPHSATPTALTFGTTVSHWLQGRMTLLFFFIPSPIHLYLPWKSRQNWFLLNFSFYFSRCLSPRPGSLCSLSHWIPGYWGWSMWPQQTRVCMTAIWTTTTTPSRCQYCSL